ncbi:MAG: SMC-Scp complex subunit ScpB [Candidatus Marinimicrobia bacterium]|nr:SMC-Scp complex subunit ScpB [Candidatus Neomarinimicrobiota bacterium]
MDPKSLNKTETHSIIEALLFSVEEPLTQEQVKDCIAKEIDLPSVIDDLNDFYARTNTPLIIQKVADGFQVMVTDRYNDYLIRLDHSRTQSRLSDSALEVLSIIAYKQPCTKSEVDSIRGVSSYLKTLLEKDLIEIKGRVSGPGRPLLYGTTKKFLKYFGLDSLDSLPRMKELEEIINEESQKDE